MSTNHCLSSSDDDLENSPLRKRARRDDVNLNTAWTLSSNSLLLHSVYDSGIKLLNNDLKVGVEEQKLAINIEETMEQISVLEASLPESTLHKLSIEEHLRIQIVREVESCFNVGDTNYFNLLSDEVILQIFKRLTKGQLSNVALVCKRFNRLAMDESLWTRMDVSHRILEPGALGTILSRQVIILRLARSRIMSPAILSNCIAAKSNFQSRLMYLDLTMATISTYNLTQLFEKCKRLKKISLENVPVSESVLKALSNSQDLEVVNLAMCIGINLDGLKPFLGNCRKIRELNMSWAYLSSGSIRFICDNLPSTLDRFNFSGCRKLLKDEGVARLVIRCPNLRELDLSDCTAITGDCIKHITALEGLNFLSLSRCYLISYTSLLWLKAVKSLGYLDVHGSYINSEHLKILIEELGAGVKINQFKFSSIARPAVGSRLSYIWNMRVRNY